MCIYIYIYIYTHTYYYHTFVLLCFSYCPPGRPAPEGDGPPGRRRLGAALADDHHGLEGGQKPARENGNHVGRNLFGQKPVRENGNVFDPDSKP